MKIHHNIVLNKHRSRLALAIVILTLTVENVKKSDAWHLVLFLNIKQFVNLIS